MNFYSTTIPVKARPKTTEAGIIWVSQSNRQTEIACLARMKSKRQVNAIHEKVIHLERVAMQPSRYPDEYDRPKRALFGLALYRWIGKRVGLDYREVSLLLMDASRVMAMLS
ncbi:MAG: hypothetical protein K8L99_02465 [Anaerolineae bacterium]|nr:hypothetical protein [Anaerolineae bacterium]